MALIGAIDPRMFEHAEKATMRVLDEMRGMRSSTRNATEYGFSLFITVGCQSFMIAPLREASFFQGPALAMCVKICK